MLQRLRENLRAFSFQVADSTLYMNGYKSLDEADEKMAADHEGVVALAKVASRIKVVLAQLASLIICGEPRMLRSTESISFVSDETTALAALFLLEVVESWSECDSSARMSRA